MMSDVEALLASAIGEDCTIDGVSDRCIFDKNGGGYEEGVKALILSSNTAVNEASIIIHNGTSYGVVSIDDDLFGERKVILGDVL